jgi:hypothetical protein
MPDDYGYPNYAAGSKSYEPFRLVNVYKKARGKGGAARWGIELLSRSRLCLAARPPFRRIACRAWVTRMQ